MLDKSRRHTGRIIKASNADVVEFGNRNQIFEIGEDQVKGFGTSYIPGFKFSKTGNIDGGSKSYSLWDETTKIIDNCLVWLMEGGASANETGVDSRLVPLTGVDLVLTQVGNIPGQVSGWRSLNGTSMEFNFSIVCADSIFANAAKTWTILIHINNYVQADVDAFFQVRGGSSAETIMIRDSGGKLYLELSEDASSENSTSTNNIPIGNNEFWVGVWADGSSVVRGGMTPIGSGSGAAGQPIKLSDFTANDRVALATKKGDFSGETFNDGVGHVFNLIGATRWMDIDVKSIVMSDTCLIDNAS